MDQTSKPDAAAWREYEAMSDRDRGHVLAYFAGKDPEGFARIMEGYRGLCERARVRAMVAAACQRERDAEADAEVPE